ncbi:MAG: ATP/GTP-binding protein [Candidatus Asgardarchaeum sp.]|nr:ATP/GTP-binding protein [Candidatus Odinarchaeota archaeon]
MYFEKPQYVVVVLGPAGSGKSTLVASFYEWLHENNVSAKCANLDPGAEYLPYDPVWDIRKYFTISQIMKTKKLGPNGAVIEAMNILLQNADKYIKELSEIKTEYLLLDTPGQLEVFAFRDVGVTFLDLLQKRMVAHGLFLIDGEMFNDIISLIVAKVLSLAVELRLSIPIISIINKGDLIDQKVVKLLDDPKKVKEIIIKSNKGELIEVALHSYDLLLKLKAALRPIIVSSTKKEGFEELYDVLHEIFCTCGDLT